MSTVLSIRDIDNMLIAEFMGAELNKDYPKIIYHTVNEKHVSYIDDIKYHSSWDWLMPVIIEIDKKFSHPFRQKTEILESLLSLSIGETWESVVRFIRWHNSNIPDLTKSLNVDSIDFAEWIIDKYYPKKGSKGFYWIPSKGIAIAKNTKQLYQIYVQSKPA